MEDPWISGQVVWSKRFCTRSTRKGTHHDGLQRGPLIARGGPPPQPFGKQEPQNDKNYGRTQDRPGQYDVESLHSVGESAQRYGRRVRRHRWE